MENHLVFKKDRIYGIQRTWLRKYSRKSVKTVVARGESHRALGAVVSATGPVSRELATWHCSDLAATLWRAYSGWVAISSGVASQF
jgi:hypothetical protein